MATAEGATALYWNPAGIARTPGGEVSLQHTEWIAGTRLEYAGAVISAGGGRVGVHAYLFESGEMDVTTLEFEDGTGEQFEVQDLSFGLSYARQLTDRFDIGGTVKYVGTRLFRTTAAAVAADVGIRYQMPFDGVTLGFGIFNFGTEMKLAGDNLARRVDFDSGTAGDNDGVLATLSTQSWDLPMLFRIGATYEAFSSDNVDVRVATDAYFPNNNNQYFNAGAEVTLAKTVHLRAGMANLLLDDTFGQGSLRLGAGIDIGGAIRADYAFADRGDLGNVSTLGATFSF